MRGCGVMKNRRKKPATTKKKVKKKKLKNGVVLRCRRFICGGIIILCTLGRLLFIRL